MNHDEAKVHAALSRAVQQLESAVQEQEAAVIRILGLAERIHANAPGRPLKIVSEAIMEACTFQDVTGQRIRKVARLVKYLRDQNLISAASLPQDNGESEKPQRQGLTQEQIDKLLAGQRVPPLS